MTQVGKFTEPIILQAKTLLQDATYGVDAKATIITAEHSNDFTLDAIKSYFVGKRFVIDAGEMPALVIWPDAGPGGEYTTETLYIELGFTVWAVCCETIEETLQKKLWRYQDAIIRCMKRTDNLDSQVDICKFAGLRFDYPWSSITERGYLDAAGVSFTINHEEKVT